MEYALRGENMLNLVQSTYVLILVLMEYALRVISKRVYINH